MLALTLDPRTLAAFQPTTLTGMKQNTCSGLSVRNIDNAEIGLGTWAYWTCHLRCMYKLSLVDCCRYHTDNTLWVGSSFIFSCNNIALQTSRVKSHLLFLRPHLLTVVLRSLLMHGVQCQNTANRLWTSLNSWNNSALRCKPISHSIHNVIPHVQCASF